MQQLNTQDAFFLQLESEEASTDVGLTVIYDPSTAPGGAVRLRDIIAHVQGRLDTSPVFRRRLVRIPLDLDNPYWIEDENFDIEFHIRHIRLPEPADWRQFHILVSKIHSRRIDLSRPAWEMWVIEGLDKLDGVAPGSYAIFYRFHHTAIDGHSARDIISGLHGPDPQRQPVAAWAPERRPHALELLARAGVNNLLRAPVRAGASLIKRAPDLARPARRHLSDVRAGRSTLRPPTVERTRFNGRVSPHRVLDHRTFSLAEVKALRTVVDGAPVNDVVISVIGGALRAYLTKYGETPRGPLGACVPVDMRAERASTEGNDIVLSVVSLAADADDPLERLRRVRDSSTAMKAKGAVAARELVALAEEFPAALFGWGLKAAIQAELRLDPQTRLYNTIVTNVPGPAAPIYMNGARATRMIGVPAIYHGMSAMFVVFSYAGEITVSVFGCREALPDPDFLAACLDEAYADLVRAAGRER